MATTSSHSKQHTICPRGWRAILGGVFGLALVLGPPSASNAPAYGKGLATSTGLQRPPPSARTIDNLVAYTRLLGYVRYFHPSDAAAATDWDLFAVRTIRSVEDAGAAPTLARTLQALFAAYAPTLRVFVTGQPPPSLPDALNPPAEPGVSITQWRYFAFRVAADVSPVTERVRQALTGGQIPTGFADPRQPYLADLGGGVSALIPLALFADQGGTLPHTPLPPQQTADDYGPSSPAVWLADIAITWNAAQHFYPYWDTLNIDWQAALRNALSAAIQASDASGFYRVLRSMMALLNDGHVYTGSPFDNAPVATLPLNWDWVQNRLVVVWTAGKAAGRVQVGDQVTIVNGRSVSAILNAPDNATGGTEVFRRWVVLRHLLGGSYLTSVKLQLRTRAGKDLTVTLHRDSYRLGYDRAGYVEPRPKRTMTALVPGIIYLDMTRITESGLRKALPTLLKAKGIVFDARGYPDYLAMYDLYGHLSSTPLHIGKYLIPIVTYPDHQRMSFQDVTSFLPLLRPRIKAKLVFLINANDTVSRAEHFLVIAEGYHLGQLVGSHTAGSNGELTQLALPGAYTVSWTGIRALKTDGSQLMHVGVLPTVPAERTIKGVIAGKDELLNRGVQVLKQELARR